ncbi:hypothetical protein K402DRAFT_388675 [Aulographum hederae CBS 113979]|uniref:Uncharacterized protein n=1 Tax=Aulographum hederae CBS 113979 TaxID=1176131 RepID=A0A6G1HFU8_9PEZI|nr:hypothetical protein K402DRAFT_388675 [Aulographum hederae CBS 113979]
MFLKDLCLHFHLHLHLRPPPLPSQTPNINTTRSHHHQNTYLTIPTHQHIMASGETDFFADMDLPARRAGEAEMVTDAEDPAQGDQEMGDAEAPVITEEETTVGEIGMADTMGEVARQGASMRSEEDRDDEDDEQANWDAAREKFWAGKKKSRKRMHSDWPRGSSGPNLDQTTSLTDRTRCCRCTAPSMTS